MEDDFDLEQQAVNIDPASLHREFAEFPGVLSHWGARYASAISEASAMAEELEDLEAEVYLELRARKDSGQTEQTIKANVRLDRRVRLKRSMLLAAEAKRVRYEKKVISALHAKREMLVSLGAHQRAELGGDPLVRRALRDERSNEELDKLVEERIRRGQGETQR
jgi:hypothetical protein